MIQDPRANCIKEGAGGTTEEAHQDRFFLFSGCLSIAFFSEEYHHEVDVGAPALLGSVVGVGTAAVSSKPSFSLVSRDEE